MISEQFEIVAIDRCYDGDARKHTRELHNAFTSLLSGEGGTRAACTGAGFAVD